MPHDFPLKDVIPTPENILLLFDDDINTGRATIHPWQTSILRDFAAPRPNDTMTRVALIAANGSGKSQFVLAPSVVWMSCYFKESLSVLTTASGEQLDTQSLRYTKRLCQNINVIMRQDIGQDVFDIKNRHIVNNITGSRIDAFATDEAGKAEGRHPIGIGTEFAIFVDEAKTVADEIFEALERCTGATRRMDISSPGKSSGYFFDVATHQETPYKIHRITAFQCPHLKKDEIEWKIKKYGLHDPLIRSSIFAEFTSVDESIIISREMLRDSQQYFTKEVRFGRPRAGLDLGGGGDETVFAPFHGNIQLGLETSRRSDTSQTVRDIIDWMGKYNVRPEDVDADEGGLGRGILDNLRDRGYPVNRVLNQSRAFDSTRYVNRGTELWFNFKLFVENYHVQLKLDNLTTSQLTNRYYRIQPQSGKLQIEPKPEAKKKGHPSPDRADAVVLAWSRYFFPCEDIIYADKPKPREGVGDIHKLAEILLESHHQRILSPLKETSSGVSPNVDGGRLVKPVNGTFSHDSIYRRNTNSKRIRGLLVG